MLNNWLKIAFINYKKNWLSTAINLFGLTVGLTGFMLILLHWNDEESFEKWNPKKDQIYYFQSYYKTDNSYGNNISVPMARRAKEVIPGVEDYVLFNGSGIGLKMTTKYKTAYQQEGMTGTESFFNFFPFKLVSGTYKNALKGEGVIALSTIAAKNLFGTTNAAGESVKFDGKNYVVTAVYELPKDNSQIKPQFIINPVQQIKDDEKNWGNFNYGCFFMLKKGTNIDDLQQKFLKEIFEYRAKLDKDSSGMTPQQYLDLYGPTGSVFTPLDEIKLHAKASWFGSPDFKTIMILFTLSVLIVVLSAINFINLKTAQASQRAKEIGVRKAIGSTRSNLIVQFLMETFVICIASYLLSLALTELLLPSFNKFFDKEMKMNDWHIYFDSFVMVILVTLISGLIPAMYLSNFKAIETLKGNFARSKHGIWLRNGILTLQLIISSFFIIGGLIVNQQVKYMMNKDLGYSGKQILIINFSESNPKSWLKYERLRTEMSKIPGVAEVSYGEIVPGSNRSSSSNVDFMDKSIQAQHGSMDYNYLQFMNVKLKKGRWLDPNLSSDTINNVLVNEAFVKKFGWNDDEVFKNEIRPGFDTKKYNIVGIVKDFNIRSLRTAIDPVIFFHYKETEWKRLNVYNIQLKIKPDDIDGTVKRIKKYWSGSVEPGYPFDYFFVDQKFAKTFEKYKRQQTLFTILNAMVLMVALLGLFALSSLMIEQKLKDVAIKKTLGASDGILIMGLTKQFLWITLVAVLISIPISYYLMNEWLKDFAYRIDMPVWPFMISLVVLLVLTFAVVSIKAYKATKVSLVKYLKYE
ncbi:ABC transporter permease [Chryseobacterium carnipullorum]|uniref:ABC transporter permease n=1 Tax=Chryseobacterium carnipullorum TaxID=1124835 RepID=A0A376E1I7_CHRCU|nr:ABC transporter permease [Chryseobacterium carnipullorum]AZA50524.1 ABC transporter permease [Chryseobacterium carnipullorum]AZA65389.1 ABC transporter permease [Chryseobacterium carnipullorum]STD00180.1 Macrolide export ATP-binding/permease protein MacB [Chryseobacterium carnipullorum]